MRLLSSASNLVILVHYPRALAARVGRAPFGVDALPAVADGVDEVVVVGQHARAQRAELAGVGEEVVDALVLAGDRRAAGGVQHVTRGDHRV